MHYTGDVVTNAGVIIAHRSADGLRLDARRSMIALFVAAVLVWTAWSVFRTSYDQLMDRELADEARAGDHAAVVDAPSRSEATCTICARARRASTPSSSFTSSSIPQISLMRAHEVSDEVEAESAPHSPTPRSSSTRTRWGWKRQRRSNRFKHDCHPRRGARQRGAGVRSDSVRTTQAVKFLSSLSSLSLPALCGRSNFLFEKKDGWPGQAGP